MKKILFLLLVFLVFSCVEDNKKTDNSNNENSNNISESKLTIELSISKIKSVIGEDLIFSVNEKDTTGFDSIILYVNDKKIKTLVEKKSDIAWNSVNEKVGNSIVRVESFHQGKKISTQRAFDLLSDIIPEKYTFKIINAYPHDIKAYTQGLFWNNGFLYESTGLKGSSSLRKVDLETGAIVQSHIIRDDFFCEGITLYKDKIIQLTWRSNVGFVYNLKDFSLEQKFNYPREGWGITTIGDSLVMSDGTATLYYLNSQNFSELSRIEVYDEKGAISYLNELEYINGEIWANVYGKKEIVRIEPTTGKVLKRIDFNTILSKSDMHKNIDVFNGIAYDKENNRIFVTGKNWTKLYEVKIFSLQ